METSFAIAVPVAERLLDARGALVVNPRREDLIRDVIAAREAVVTRSGALSSWSPPASTGRIPQDTYVVRRGRAERWIDWSSAGARALSGDAFDQLHRDARALLSSPPVVYRMDRSVGADEASALPLTVLTPSPLIALFADAIFRPAVCGGGLLRDEAFTLLVLPRAPLQWDSYIGALREDESGVVPRVIATDYDRHLGLILGTSYLGAVKKFAFTAAATLLPELRVLPLHCAATRDVAGGTHLFLGLSGTGKTTLSSDPALRMIGDDEHLWSEEGIANLEGGCYAKLIRLRADREPTIHAAALGDRPAHRNGAILENVMTYPDGTVDVDDSRLTENSRAAYPLVYLPGVVPESRGDHPSTIVFLTADAHGVLPAVARLTPEQALLWYALGYSSKLAGTETGVVAPQSTFSRFFGAPFMLRHAETYLAMLRERLARHRPTVYLVNTGWFGGPVGVGKRLEIAASRAIVRAAVTGRLGEVAATRDERFAFEIPARCDGVDDRLLDPRGAWSDPAAYDLAANDLVTECIDTLQGHFAGALPEEARAALALWNNGD